MEESIFSIDASKLEDISEGLRNAGFYQTSVNEPVPTREIRDIISTLSSKEREKLAEGDAQLITRGRTTFTNGGDDISINDFDLVDVERVRTDPVISVREKVKGRTSDVVREILEDVVKVDVLKFGLKSILSRQFKTSVADLARLEGISPKLLYRKYCDILITSCVRGVKADRLDIEKILRPELVGRKTKLEVTA